MISLHLQQLQVDIKEGEVGIWPKHPGEVKHGTSEYIDGPLEPFPKEPMGFYFNLSR